MQKKFNSVLQKEIENIEYKEKEQKKLRKKHGIDIEAEKTYIVEKDNMITFLIKLIISTIKLVGNVVLISLATLGLIALVYPNIRIELMKVINEAYNAFTIGIR
jgi:hypothetical protein